jgi:hypothetical protein
LPDETGSRTRGFDEVNLERSPAQSFNPNRARAGAKIEPDFTFKGGRVPGAQHIEEGFPQPVGGGAQVQPAERAQGTAAKFSGDYSHGTGLSQAILLPWIW